MRAIDSTSEIRNPVKVLNPAQIQNEILYGVLANMGNFYPLDISFDIGLVNRQLEPFREDWKHYNPRKPENPRKGLSLTSLDGQLNGVPDLDSLTEYNRRHKTDYREWSFTKPTTVLETVSSIRDPLKPLLPYLGRTHLLQLDQGGFFPFHRDSAGVLGDSATFRLIALLDGCGVGQFCFLYDTQRIFLEVGLLYFLNTSVDHALFSFGDNSRLLVLNVVLNSESVSVVVSHLMSK